MKFGYLVTLAFIIPFIISAVPQKGAHVWVHGIYNTPFRHLSAFCRQTSAIMDDYAVGVFLELGNELDLGYLYLGHRRR